MLERLVEGLRDMGYEMSPSVVDRFETYREELLRWNERVNLTAITDPREVEIRHFLDSLTALPQIADRAPSGAAPRLIDVGSGAGFPGIPLKLMLPGARLTLLEATGKKAEFLRYMVSRLELNATEVVYGRAEDVAHLAGHREAYDFAIARAVAPMATLVEICLPFVAIGGTMVALKKGDLKEELEEARTAVRTLGGAELRLREVVAPHLPDHRVLVCCTKENSTPLRFPRRPGMPFKHPLMRTAR